MKSTKYHIDYDYAKYKLSQIPLYKNKKLILGIITIVNYKMNRTEFRTDFDDEVRIVRAQRATTAILTRHLLILHCQEDHCTRMRKYVVTYTHELLTFSLFFSCTPSFFLTFSFFLSLFLVYLIPTNDGVFFMRLQSLMRLELICEVTVSLLFHAKNKHRIRQER